jgi:hypothetical protein
MTSFLYEQSAVDQSTGLSQKADVKDELGLGVVEYEVPKPDVVGLAKQSKNSTRVDKTRTWGCCGLAYF